MDYQYDIADPVVSFIEGWKKNNLIPDSISIKNFEHKLLFDFNQAIVINGQHFIPAGQTGGGISDSFHVYRYLTYRPENWKESIAIKYYVAPGNYTFRSVQQLVKDHSHIGSNIRLYRSFIHESVAENNLASYTGNKLSVKKSPEIAHRDAPLDEGCEWVEIEWYWQTWENGVLISEEYLFSTNEAICEPGAGGNGGADTTIVPTNNPCDSVNVLANNSEFKAILDSVKARISGNREYAYKFSNSTTTTVDETLSIGEPDALGVHYEVGANEKLDGVIHNHFRIDGKSVSIFSIADMDDFINLFEDGNINNSYSFSFTLPNYYGRQYMLRIQNVEEFTAFATKFKDNVVTRVMYDIYIKHDEEGKNYVDINETNFLRFLSENDSGLKFFKQNNTTNNWDPLKYSSGQVISAPCN